MRVEHFDRIGWINLEHLLWVSDVCPMYTQFGDGASEGWGFRYRMQGDAQERAVKISGKDTGEAGRLQSQVIRAWKGICRHGVSGLRCDCCYGAGLLALAAGTRRAETNEDLAQSEGCQSGDAKQRNARGPSRD